VHARPKYGVVDYRKLSTEEPPPRKRIQQRSVRIKKIEKKGCNILRDTFLLRGGIQFQECRMKCHRCGSVMVYEKFYGPEEHFLRWRCVLCGEIIDQVILGNREAKPDRQHRERRIECDS
jgi:hypothetical protein